MLSIFATILCFLHSTAALSKLKTTITHLKLKIKKESSTLKENKEYWAVVS